jgi:phosphoglycolate phosphatase
MGKIQLVILDFDGTLVDTAPDLVRATNFFMDFKGFSPLPEEQIRAEIGMGLKKLIIDLYPEQSEDKEFHNDLETEFLTIYEREYLASPKLFDGAMEFLQSWPGQKAIVSNKKVRFIKPILQKLGIDNIGWSRVIGGDTYPHMKPHPQPFLEAIQSAGATPEETLIVGDGLPDVQGALAIGCQCVAVEFGYTPADQLIDLGAWSKIASFHDLLPLISSLS